MKKIALAFITCLVLYGCDAEQTVKGDMELDEFVSGVDTKSQQKTYRELLPLAERGNARAQFALASMYEAGDGVALNATAALRWYRRAADNGYGLAHFRLGLKYIQGADVTPSKSAAIEHLYKAGLAYLNAGDRNAMLSALNLISALDSTSPLKKQLLDEIEKAGCETWGPGSSSTPAQGCAESFINR